MSDPFMEAIREENVSSLQQHSVRPLITRHVSLPSKIRRGQQGFCKATILVSPYGSPGVRLCYPSNRHVPKRRNYGTHVVPWDQWESAIASIGRPVSNTEAKIVAVDGGDTELGPNEEGELWVRGPQVFKGYHNNPTVTATSVTPDGWYKTGDVAYVNEKGFFYITDRVKELIKYNGFQVAPAELEGLLLAHPQIEAAADIGLFYEDIATEVPRAYVVVKKGVEKTQETADGIANWLKERTAYHKWLRGGVKFVDEIPMNASGKILRKELKALAEKEGRGRVWKL